MRVAIREQLAALVLVTVLISLAVLSIPVWIYVNDFVQGVENRGLSLTASLKSAQVASEIQLVQTICNTIGTRLLLQNAFKTYYSTDDASSQFELAAADLQSALDAGSGSSSIFQARLYSRNETGGGTGGLLNVTSNNIVPITLPYKTHDGSEVLLGDSAHGYPEMLYPNITYYPSDDPDPFNPGHTAVVARPFPDIRIDSRSDGLILGPLVVNETYALMSLTTPIRENNTTDIILGYMTIVASAGPILDIMDSKEGLGDSGSVLIIGPSTGWNRFSKYNLPANSTTDAVANFSSVDVQFVLPPRTQPGTIDRHTFHNWASGAYSKPFKSDLYEAVFKAFTDRNPAINNASSMLATTNEQGVPVAVGYARPPTALVNWTLIVEQSKSEADVPIDTLRNIILGCVFGTIGLVLIFIFPCAHFSVNPIRRLKSATEKSIAPPGCAEAYMTDLDYHGSEKSGSSVHHSEKGVWSWWRRFLGRPDHARRVYSNQDTEPKRTVFKIPGKVESHKHFITDELTELTTTFNEMSDELYQHYASLEDKVALRTRELEISKKAAEAANESKTLFIANISHELKTPLNAILGLATVSMEETDITKVRASMKDLYKSGDILLHLLEDLLIFSKNQIGHQLTLEQKEFRLGDVRSQILTIFDKQVREKTIDFSVEFSSTNLDMDHSPVRTSLDGKLPAMGPQGTCRLRDMCVWGDQHRILQVLINLVGNSLKFTPNDGKVSLRIRCIGEFSTPSDEKGSMKNSSGRRGRTRRGPGSESNYSTSSKVNTPSLADSRNGPTSSIRPVDSRTESLSQIHDGSSSPLPPSAKVYMFEFEVQDSGPGIPEHMQKQIFEPFVQGDLRLSRKHGGTGLGLSICQQLATLMGGTVQLSSTVVGAGATFKMRIPLKYTSERRSSTASSSLRSRTPSTTSLEVKTRRDSLIQPIEVDAKANILEQQPRLVGLSQPFFAAGPATGPVPRADEQVNAAEIAAATKKGGKLRVLVAEDNKINIEVVTKLLKLEDVIDVTIAKDGQEAYDLVKEAVGRNSVFDLILMDIQMPNLDGLQSTRLIRNMGYSAPIVALTAFSDESNIKDCMESGMNEFLAKPIKRPALKGILKKFATIPEEPESNLSSRSGSTGSSSTGAVSQVQVSNVVTTTNDADNDESSTKRPETTVTVTEAS